MTIRKDGIEHREKLLEAAAEIFAEKGYRNATVAGICRHAGSNIAAIHYHFGSKDQLYIAVWKRAFEEAMKVYPPDGGLSPDASAEEKLRALIYSHIHRILDAGKLGFSGQILLREMAEPTEAIRQIHHDAIAPLRKTTQQVMKELLGPLASEQDIHFCALSVVHQCIAMGFSRSRKNFPAFLRKNKLNTELIDQLADHTVLFSLAGIAAVREKIESRKKDSEKDC